MNRSGPAVAIRLVSENPYFRAMDALVPTPNRAA
jgi:hypothetical protein